jgi:hypothetical protein
MRPTLALAWTLLGVALALRFEDVWVPRPTRRTQGADEGLELIVGARGALLPPAALGTGPETIGEAMRLGDRTLVAPAPMGLRAAWLAEDLTFLAFDAPADRAAVRTLAARIEAARSGVVALGWNGGSGDAEASSALQGIATLLGARARPGSVRPESWALIAMREDHGWVPLAEAYSQDSGVALAYVLAPGQGFPRGHRGDFVLERGDRRGELALDGELAQASVRTPFVEAGAATVLGRPFAGLRFAPTGTGSADAARLVWEQVPIGAGAGLVTWLGLEDGDPAASDGVRFEVRVDGELLETRAVKPGERWRPLQVDFSAFAGRRVRLELVGEAGASVTGDALFLGRPMLVRGYDRAPLDVWLDER